MTSTASLLLSTLPLEILCIIIPLLDPISLISLSQTSRDLRHIINPKKHHFEQRLLALELLPDHGGIVPTFRARDNKLEPSWDSPEWKQNRYACCGCMKLLPHMRFDNHQILGLYLRKPPLGSIEFERLADWDSIENSSSAAYWERVQARKHISRTARDEYHLATSGHYNNELDFDVVDTYMSDSIANFNEPLLCGRIRHKRRCNECRRLRGDWSRPTRDYGKLVAPIVRSRQLPFHSSFERYFPGLVNQPRGDKIPRLFRVWQSNTKTNLFTLYTARCMTCGVWQELAAFRLYSPYHLWKPTIPTYGNLARGQSDNLELPAWPAPCNHCAFRTVGRELFAKRLAEEATKLAQSDLDSVISRLRFGWHHLKRDFQDEHGILKDYHHEGNRVLRGLKWVPRQENDDTEGSHGVDLKFVESDMTNLRDRVRYFRTFMATKVPYRIRHRVMESWFKLWTEDYELNEAEYFRIQDAIARIHRDPNWLVDYVLERAPYRV